MNTLEIKLENWEEMKGRLIGLREACWLMLRRQGPMTTRALATVTGLDVLTVRPRVTELCELGFARLCGRAGREGVYEALSLEEVRASLEVGADRQMVLF